MEEADYRGNSPLNKGNGKSETTYLDVFGEDLTDLAKKGLLDPVFGRDEEVQRICQILSRRKKNNPIILGDPGVGKTALVEAVAQRIAEGSVAHTMKNKRLISLNMSSIVAGTKYRGEFEERMKKIVDELKANPHIIVFVDEIHTMAGAGGAGGSLDASNILKPALARGQVHCIGATTLDEYRQHIESDGALTRRFQEVFVPPPSIDDTIKILDRIKSKYEEHHMVRYTTEAIESCVKMSERYITSRMLPDKAIDLLDEAGAMVHLRNVEVPDEIKNIELEIDSILKAKQESIKTHDYENAGLLRNKELLKKKELEEATARWEDSFKNNPREVGVDEIAVALSMQTGIPVTRLSGDEKRMVKNLANQLKTKVIGQDTAVEALGKVIKRSRAGVNSHKKPIGSFMFLGPTGVGKTETVKALTEYMFGSEDAMIRIDMSEYQEKFNVSRLTGAPPGYVGHDEGGQLTEAVRRKPYSVVLFDEIEKAHPDTFNLLLQVLDDGRLTDSLGRVVNFTNTIIIMTSNVGAKKVVEYGKGIGLSSRSAVVNEKSNVEAIINKELKNSFAPEFLNRLDDIILFNHLKDEDIFKIVDIELAEVTQRMVEQNIMVSFTTEAKEFLVKEGYDPAYGARPLKRAIQKYVEDLLADAILEDNTKSWPYIHTITHISDEEHLTLI